MKFYLAVIAVAVAGSGCHVHSNSPTARPVSRPAVPIIQPTTDSSQMSREPVIEKESMRPVPMATKPAVQVRPTSDNNEKPVFRPEPVTYNPPPKKPFFAPVSILPPEQPSPLLLQHARSDSPIPLQQYGQQKTFAVSDFPLSWETSADDLQRQIGPPAQLADYSNVWFVYRLKLRKELWLHFTQPGNSHLLAADVINSDEDGYHRERVFSAAKPR